MNKSSKDRKTQIEERLRICGIHGYEISYLPYLDFDPDAFAKPYEVGCRMMILSALSLAAENAEDKPAILNWLRKEGILEHVNPNELLFLEANESDPRTSAEYSWKIESAYTLAWTLGLVSSLSKCPVSILDEEFDSFCKNVPLIGDDLQDFLPNLNYINKVDIIDENLFNELVTTYFRDLFLNGKKDMSAVDATVSFERHRVLNWVRRFMDIDEWDEVDTAT